MKENSGLGKVISKNIPAIQDTLFNGFLTAVKHGNGKDWWVLAPQHLENCFFKVLLSSNGVDSIGLQCFDGVPWELFDDNGGQAAFSPDGTRYAVYQTCQGLNLYHFDRCDGELSNYTHISMEDDPCNLGGIAFSPNSRFLYVTTHLRVYQFDLWATDIAASKTLLAEWNGSNISGVIDYFFLCQLAPDNKIYIGTSSLDGLVNNMHVINSPNSEGLACNLVPGAINLPSTFHSSLPNFPHYRLGPIEGGCDSTIVTAQTRHKKPSVKVYPNPSPGRFTVEVSDWHDQLKLTIFDVLGREIASKPLSGGQMEFHLEYLEDGVYFMQVLEGRRMIGQQKIVIQN